MGEKLKPVSVDNLERELSVVRRNFEVVLMFATALEFVVIY